ncbi:hypothetical protein LY71_106211 [Geodermatophilus tzadiensis]|jgi:hypothetical protein|uniref:Uncharacterized protein n=2 Tax=Geodermatophilus TaxID=1860 RepID=A0A1I5NSE1_9ACTN|nr:MULTISPECIES: hypothetical protein [Geodermatophilus]PRY49433.1 hypothetical protein LY71_106211 [Geodermatophilus tzadiensis]SFP24749.1 hypothetical protein SAMN05660464_2671 [Geodermatophilus dictyosporus]
MGSEPPGEDALVLPPVPLATGRLLRLDDESTVAVTAVELVVSTEDGAEHRIALVPRHGAWWPPDR